MWKYMIESLFRVKEKDIDMDNSFYCGDAAGRKSDFSNDDLLYSINLSLKFYTPEMLFKKSDLNFKLVPGVKISEEFKNSKAEEEKK